MSDRYAQRMGRGVGVVGRGWSTSLSLSGEKVPPPLRRWKILENKSQNDEAISCNTSICALLFHDLGFSPVHNSNSILSKLCQRQECLCELFPFWPWALRGILTIVNYILESII